MTLNADQVFDDGPHISLEAIALFVDFFSLNFLVESFDLGFYPLRDLEIESFCKPAPQDVSLALQMLARRTYP